MGNNGASLAVAFLALILALAGVVLPESVGNGGNGGVALTLFGFTMNYSHTYPDLVRYMALNEKIMSNTESATQCPIIEGNFTELKIRVRINNMNADGVILLRKNGLDTALSVTIPAFSTGIFKTVLDVTCADDDLVNLKIDFTDATGATNVVVHWCVVFAPS